MASLPVITQREVLPRKELPGLSTILILDAVVAKVHVALDDAFSQNAVSDTLRFLLSKVQLGWIYQLQDLDCVCVLMHSIYFAGFYVFSLTFRDFNYLMYSVLLQAFYLRMLLSLTLFGFMPRHCYIANSVILVQHQAHLWQVIKEHFVMYFIKEIIVILGSCHSSRICSSLPW